ncbi:MAG: hypothetical protein WC761_03050 [Candidatus Paceibacterota bacterium]|jgi:hypothetical protein
MTKEHSAKKIAAAVTVLGGSPDWDVLDPQVIIDAHKAGLLRPAITRYLKNKEWLKLDPVWKCEIEKNGQTAEEWLSGRDCSRAPGVEEVLRDRDFEVGPKETSTIHFYTAEMLGVGNWWGDHLYSDTGLHHLANYGLSFCRLDDVPCIRKKLEGQEQVARVKPLHAPVHIRGYSNVLDISAQGTARILSAYHLRSNDQVEPDMIIAVRKIVQS